MNTFYFNDKTEKIVKEKPQNSYTEIKTNKSYDEIIECFTNCRLEGCSIVDSIEWSS